MFGLNKPGLNLGEKLIVHSSVCVFVCVCVCVHMHAFGRLNGWDQTCSVKFYIIKKYNCRFGCEGRLNAHSMSSCGT